MPVNNRIYFEGGASLFRESLDGRPELILEIRIVQSPNTKRYIVLQEFHRAGPFLDLNYKIYNNPVVGDFGSECDGKESAVKCIIEMGNLAYNTILSEDKRIKENLSKFKC